MKSLRDAILLWIVVASSASSAQEFFDRLSDLLTVSSADASAAGRLSGTLDAEAYSFSHPAPDLIYSSGNTLFNPRLSLFIDAQFGPRVYFFSQARIDRGFDPAAARVRARLDEYALRIRIGRSGNFGVQLGQFATVVGRWAQRHGSWENAFVTAPAAYGNLTGIWDSAAARSTETLLSWSHVRPSLSAPDEYTDKHLRLPLIWGPSYATGAAVMGTIGKVDIAAEVKNASLSSRPESWNLDAAAWSHPTLSARVGYRPNLMWNAGLSASTGVYLRASAGPSVAAGYRLSDYRQTVIIQDVSFAWRHLQAWAEFAHGRFEIPRVGLADTFAGFVELRYKFTPQFSGAVRMNRQTFGDLSDSRGRRTAWGRDLWQLDAAPIYRFTTNLQGKLQYSLKDEAGLTGRRSHTTAAQLTLRF